MGQLTQEDFQEMLVVYAKQKRNVPSYRLGQSIYRQMFELTQNEPVDVEELAVTIIKAGRPDFYYWTDESAVMTELLEHYVEDHYYENTN